MPFGTTHFQILNNTFWTIKILRFRDHSVRVKLASVGGSEVLVRSSNTYKYFWAGGNVIGEAREELPCSIMEALFFDSFHRVASDKPTVAVGEEVVNQSTTV